MRTYSETILKEMLSNETAGHEMETTENEIAALDLMVSRLTDSTFVVSDTLHQISLM